MLTPVSDTLRTRSGLSVHRSLQALKPSPEIRTKVSKSSKMKKSKKDKVKAEPKVAKLQKPLSELTKAWDHVPIVDIEAYVNRPVEVRRKEVEDGKIAGKVKRPMNSFMLYRKAYQNRTKNWCLQNNHQVVSQVCGDSWPLEPESVRDQFIEWARLERKNHQNAHPLYKFSPTKPDSIKSTKRKVSETSDAESEASDLSDFEWQGSGTKKQKKQQRPSARPTGSERYATSSPYPYTHAPSEDSHFERSHVSSYGPNPSSYGVSNPGKLYPVQYSQANLRNGQYYQHTVRKNTSQPGPVEDVMMRMTDAPGTHHHYGVPRGQAYMMDPYQFQEGSMTPEYKIDPSLVSQDRGLYDDGYIDQESMYLGGSFNSDPQWNSSYGTLDPDLYEGRHGYVDTPQGFNGMQLQDQHMQILKGGQDAWSVEPLDVGQEFDKWMDDREV
jgi:hypothetical protein